MDKRFKWNMFITSFMPLWISIVVADLWSIIENGIRIWSCKKNLSYNLNLILEENIVRGEIV